MSVVIILSADVCKFPLSTFSLAKRQTRNPVSKSGMVSMLVRLLQNLQCHAHFDNPLTPGRSQHPKARLELDPLVNATIRDQRIPRLLLVLDSRFGIHIRYLAARTARNDIHIQRFTLIIWD